MALPEDATIESLRAWLAATDFTNGSAETMIYGIRLCCYALRNSVGDVTLGAEHYFDGTHRLLTGVAANRPAVDTARPGQLYLVVDTDGDLVSLDVSDGTAFTSYNLQAADNITFDGGATHPSLTNADEAHNRFLGLTYDESVNPDSTLVKSEKVYFKGSGSTPTDPPASLTDTTLFQFMVDVISFLWGNGGLNPGIEAGDIFYQDPTPSNTTVEAFLDVLHTWKAAITNALSAAEGAELVGLEPTGITLLAAAGSKTVRAGLAEHDRLIGLWEPGASADVAHVPAASSFLEDAVVTEVDEGLEALNADATKRMHDYYYHHQSVAALPDTSGDWDDAASLLLTMVCPVDPSAFHGAAAYIDNITLYTFDNMTGTYGGVALPWFGISITKNAEIDYETLFSVVEARSDDDQWEFSNAPGHADIGANGPLVLTSNADLIKVQCCSDNIGAQVGFSLSFRIYWYEKVVVPA